MATTMDNGLRLKGLGRAKMDQLAKKAKRLGMTPERYVKRLVEQDLAVAHTARMMTFRQILGPGREVDERELDRLVDVARTEHHLAVSRKKR